MGCAPSRPARAPRGNHQAATREAPELDTESLSSAAEPTRVREAADLLTGDARNKLVEGRTVEEVYTLGKILGRGGFATVRLGVHRDTGHQVAVKLMDVVAPGRPVGGNDNTWADVAAEIEVLARLQHPNIIALHEVFMEQRRVCLVTSLVKGGELLDAVLTRALYSEAIVRGCFRQLLEGVAYCHAHGVTHRDIKLDNLLLERPGDISQIRIVDFGLAKGHETAAAVEMKTVCGTPHYVAPEVVTGRRGARYGPEVDLWSCGVVLFVLLSGTPPFFEPSGDDGALFRTIRRGEFSFQDPVWDLVSDEAKDLVQRLLVVDPCKRLTAEEALEHPWLLSHRSAAIPGKEPSLAGALENLKGYKGRMRPVDT